VVQSNALTEASCHHVKNTAKNHTESLSGFRALERKNSFKCPCRNFAPPPKSAQSLTAVTECDIPVHPPQRNCNKTCREMIFFPWTPKEQIALQLPHFRTKSWQTTSPLPPPPPHAPPPPPTACFRLHLAHTHTHTHTHNTRCAHAAEQGRGGSAWGGGRRGRRGKGGGGRKRRGWCSGC
jgi:hypothetical protein